LDSFFVSVECLKNPALKGKPVVIGGDGNLGVVTSASYEARRFGVHAGMSAREAKQLCTSALFIRGDMESYAHYSRLITNIIARKAPLFEKASIDEFYVDITGMDRYIQDSEKWATELRKQIIEESKLPISMGISVNKLVAKVATNEAKPNGQLMVRPKEVRDFLAPLDIAKIPMIGKASQKVLRAKGINNVLQLREYSRKLLEDSLGKNGISFWNKAHGIDGSRIVPHSDRKSISTECTFHHDRIDVRKLKAMLTAMVEKLTFKLREEQFLTSCVGIRIRYTNFRTESKQKHLPYTTSDHVITGTALHLFDELFSKKMRLRLVGVRLSGLVRGSHQIDMFDDTAESICLYQAMDKIRHKHGIDSVVRASTHGVNKRVRMENNVFRNV
jgi:DNA polymerase-4